jgi:hypothetical protein
MDHCLRGTSRRVGLPPPRDLRSNTVNGSLKAARAGAIGLKGAPTGRARRMKEPDD